MDGPLTVLWLVDRDDVPDSLDPRFRHVVGDPDRPGATIARLVGEGPVLAVVGRPEDGARVLAFGVDEVAFASEVATAGFDTFVDRTLARSRGRMLRDLYLIDLVRKDDTNAIALLAAALGRELLAPLARVSEDSKDLLDAAQSAAPDSRARARSIVQSVESMARFVEKTQALLDAGPTDETVDLVQVVRSIADAVAPGVATVAALRVDLPHERCLVGMPRWQLALIVANLVSNAAQSISARGGSLGEIEIRVSVEEGAVALEVTDNGGGMEPDVRVHANDLFYTTENERQRLGMGLTLVTARVRRAGGEVIIESDHGAGTTVRVFLPVLSLAEPGGDAN